MKNKHTCAHVEIDTYCGAPATKVRDGLYFCDAHIEVGVGFEIDNKMTQEEMQTIAAAVRLLSVHGMMSLKIGKGNLIPASENRPRVGPLTFAEVKSTGEFVYLFGRLLHSSAIGRVDLLHGARYDEGEGEGGESGKGSVTENADAVEV